MKKDMQYNYRDKNISLIHIFPTEIRQLCLKSSIQDNKGVKLLAWLYQISRKPWDFPKSYKVINVCSIFTKGHL